MIFFGNILKNMDILKNQTSKYVTELSSKEGIFMNIFSQFPVYKIVYANLEYIIK